MPDSESDNGAMLPGGQKASAEHPQVQAARVAGRHNLFAVSVGGVIGILTTLIATGTFPDSDGKSDVDVLREQVATLTAENNRLRSELANSKNEASSSSKGIPNDLELQSAVLKMVRDLRALAVEWEDNAKYRDAMKKEAESELRSHRSRDAEPEQKRALQDAWFEASEERRIVEQPFSRRYTAEYKAEAIVLRQRLMKRLGRTTSFVGYYSSTHFELSDVQRIADHLAVLGESLNP